MASYLRNNGQRGSAVVIVLTVVAVVVTIGAIAFVLVTNGGKNNSINLGKIGHKTISASTPDEVKTLLAEAKAGKYDAKCTYLLKSVESTLYLHGDAKMRVDTVIEDKPGHFVRLGDSVYIWADGNPKGSKLPISDKNKDSQYTPDGFASKAEEYDIKCESVGRLSDTLFTLPSDVTFTDLNSQLRSSSSSSN